MELPIGTIVAYYGDERTFNATGDYLICNGSKANKGQYQDLYYHLEKICPELILDENTFRLPDLRGEFLRGCDNNRNVDPKRIIGSFQEESIKKQEFTFLIPKPSDCRGSSRGLDGGENRFIKGNESVKISLGNSTESRPRNVAVNWIIRAK